MSNFTQFRSNEEELSLSSDEKMDTGSESFRSQDTPNSIRSSDFEDHPENLDQNVLRLQNPEEIDIGPPENDEDFLKPKNSVSDFLKSNSSDTDFLVSNISVDLNDLRTPDVFKNFQKDMEKTDGLDNIEKMSTARSANGFENHSKHDTVDVKSSKKNHLDEQILESATVQLRNQDLNNENSIANLNSESVKHDAKSAKKSVVNAFKAEDLSDSFIKKMSNLKLDSPKDVRPKNLGISPPKFSSTLTLTTSHPLMGLGSPDDFPDLIPKKHKEEDRDLSLSSIEDERVSETNGLYSPQKNNSKNNLYFTENFVTAESHILSQSLDLPPDVVTRVERRKIVPRFELTPQRNTGLNLDGFKGESGKVGGHSTPKGSQPVDIAEEEFHSGVAEWCESPSQLRALPNFDLPIEMSSAIGMRNDLDSPDMISSSTQEERSAYEAKLDPYTGSVALRHTTPKVHHQNQRRKIMLPPEEEDRCSLDSISASSMESEEEPPMPMPQPASAPDCNKAADDVENASDDDTKRSKSTNTISYSSEPIPEYSLCEELSNERGWVSVHSHACDVKVIEPYKRVLSHGGYSSTGAALIVFSACHLPDNARHDYTYVMDNLFLYVIWTLERLVTDEYILVYLHGSAGSRRLPAFHWLHECYKLIDRRLRKSLKQLYLVHPTFWLKSFVLLTKPFVSSKFFKKLSYVKTLDELMEKVPVDPNAIPEIVKQYDANRKR